ncbi:hypothetical protein [Neobacillus drentensis]
MTLPDSPPDGGQDWLVHYYFDSKTLTWNGPFGLFPNRFSTVTGVTGF